MIAYLRGRVIEKDAEALVLDVGGVGYLLAVSASTLKVIPAAGGEAQLHVHSHAVQDGPLQLFGFADPEERRLFQTLLGVQGVGPKVALAILSGLPPSELVRAITGGDVARLTQIRGVGRKTAERLAVELRDKLGPVSATRTAAGGLPSPLVGAPAGRRGEVYGALVSLGYRPAEFDSLLSELDPALSTPDLVRQALASLRRR